MTVLDITNFLTSYSVDPECVKKLGAELMSHCSNVLLFIAIFAALFLGTDHSNGTIRNKLIIGHKRFEIYFSNLITAAVGGLILIAAEWSVVLITGFCLGGEIGMPAEEMLLKMLICISAVIALSAIFTLLGMLFTSKSTIITITLVMTFVLVIGAAVIESILAEPEYVTSFEMMTDGVVTQGEAEPNPLYVSGAKRGVLEAVNDVLPSGQMMQMEIGTLRSAELMPLYSLGVIAVSTAVGVLVFRRKDLK
ncbi:MAG: ABC transporter permease subunit [Ruminococcaceae bacterium]|nr:ABC transporter permease subunit [Oscillospiraceae bacterium]